MNLDKINRLLCYKTLVGVTIAIVLVCGYILVTKDCGFSQDCIAQTRNTQPKIFSRSTLNQTKLQNNVSSQSNASVTSHANDESFHTTFEDVIDVIKTEQFVKSPPIYMWKSGRLGNHMWQFAGGLSISLHTKRPLYILPDVEKNLRDIFTFENKGIYHVGKPPPNTHVEKELVACPDRINQMFFNLPNKPLKIQGYLLCEDFLEGIKGVLRRMFTIKEDITTRANAYLSGLAAELQRPLFIAVHVRRGDIMKSVHTNQRYMVPEVSFFRKAMDYFRQNYGHVHFVMVSNDVAWCKKAFSNVTDVTISEQDRNTDFATLTLCEHIIVSWGTFAYWAAWLHFRDVVYFEKQFGGELEYRNEHYRQYVFPAHWKPMGN